MSTRYHEEGASSNARLHFTLKARAFLQKNNQTFMSSFLAYLIGERAGSMKGEMGMKD